MITSTDAQGGRMKDSELTRSVDQTGLYEIQVLGILDESWSGWFGGMMITVEKDVTTMSGSVPDQTALRGILDRIWDLNLALISVRRTDIS
jgi:hypothetical protein